MGANCFKDGESHGNLLPVDSQSDENREEIERQESVLRKHETELTEKQNRYLALQSELETEKTKVSKARKDLSDAVTEGEIFKSTIRELNGRLKECEKAVFDLKQTQNELERVNGLIKSAESGQSEIPSSESLSESQKLEFEIDSAKLQIEAANKEFERAKSDFDLNQRKLRETEEIVAELEQKEVEMEKSLGEEASKHENARKVAYLRGLYLFALRRIQRVEFKYSLIWSKNAKKITKTTAEKRKITENLHFQVENLFQSFELLPKAEFENSEILSESDSTLSEIQFLISVFKQSIEKVEKEVKNINLETGKISERLKSEFPSENEIKIDLVAKHSNYGNNKEILEKLNSQLSEAAKMRENIENLINKNQQIKESIEKQLEENFKTVEIAKNSLFEFESNLKSEKFNSEPEITEKIEKLSELIENRKSELKRKSEEIIEEKRENSHLGTETDLISGQLSNLDHISKLKSEIQEMLEISKNAPIQLENSEIQLEKTTEVEENPIEDFSESQEVVEETELAAENPEIKAETELAAESGNLTESGIPVEEKQTESGKISEISSLEEEKTAENEGKNREMVLTIPEIGGFDSEVLAEIESNVLLKAILRKQTSEVQILPLEAVLETVNSMFGYVFKANSGLESQNQMSPKMNNSVLDYFLSQSESEVEALTRLNSFTQSINQITENQPGSYLSLIMRICGLNARFPMLNIEQKLLSKAISLVFQPIKDYERKQKSQIDPLKRAETGGFFYLIDAIRAIYKLFPDSPTLGEAALISIKPNISLQDHLRFMICFRLKELNKDSMQLFKAIDVDKSGKIDAEEFAEGVQRHLGLWMSRESIKELFKDIDRDGSGSITKVELNKSLNFKEYYSRCASPEYTLSLLDFLAGVSAGLGNWREAVLRPLENAAKDVSGGTFLLSDLEIRAVLESVSGLNRDYVAEICTAFSQSPAKTPFSAVRTHLYANPPSDLSALSNP